MHLLFVFYLCWAVLSTQGHHNRCMSFSYWNHHSSSSMNQPIHDFFTGIICVSITKILILNKKTLFSSGLQIKVVQARNLHEIWKLKFSTCHVSPEVIVSKCGEISEFLCFFMWHGMHAYVMVYSSLSASLLRFLTTNCIINPRPRTRWRRQGYLVFRISSLWFHFNGGFQISSQAVVAQQHQRVKRLVSHITFHQLLLKAYCPDIFFKDLISFVSHLSYSLSGFTFLIESLLIQQRLICLIFFFSMHNFLFSFF